MRTTTKRLEGAEELGGPVKDPTSNLVTLGYLKFFLFFFYLSRTHESIKIRL